MEKIREKVANRLGIFKDYIRSYKLVEQVKNVVYFSKFTWESEEFFQIHNFVITLKYNIVRSLIDQFKYCINNIISFSDKALSERDKIMTIYSACFLNYYKKFLYDTKHNFEEFYDQNFLYLIKTFNIEILNLDLFKVLSYSFFNRMKEEINKLNYEEKIKPLKHFYNSKLNNEDNEIIKNTLFSSDNNKNEVINKDNNNLKNKIKIEGLKVKDKAINYMISAKEKIVDIIYEIQYRNLFPKIFSENNNEINNMNIRLNKLNNISAQNLDNLYKTLEKEKIQFNDLNGKQDINMSLNDDKTSVGYNESLNNSINLNLNQSFNSINKTSEISNNDSFKSNMDFISNIKNKNKNSNDINFINNFNIPNNDNANINKINFINDDNRNNTQNNFNEIKINNQQININNQSKSVFKPNNITINNTPNKDNIYSHRLIEELIKNKIDEKTKEIITNVAKIINENYLDFLLNNSPKPILILEYFCCYVATFTPQQLQKIDPYNAKSLENIYIKFIILSKELYNTAMELFCSLYDLTSTNINRFLDLAGSCGIHIQYAKGLYKILKDYSIFLLEENAFHDLRKTIDKFVEMERINWEKAIDNSNNNISSF